MSKSNKTVTWMKCMMILTGILVLLCLFNRAADWRKQGASGVPDALSSVVSGGTCSLTVVANTNHIDDKELFAREVIRMCRENAFRSLRLSTDVLGWPEELDITVYYHREDIDGGAPVMRILYKPVSGDEKTSIEDGDPEKYILNIE